jgi:hypothetical protein
LSCEYNFVSYRFDKIPALPQVQVKPYRISKKWLVVRNISKGKGKGVPELTQTPRHGEILGL